MGFYIPANSLENIKLYKYGSEDHSVLSKYVLRPFWVKFETLFPLWMAPNVITLLGLMFVVFNVFTALYLDPNLTGGSPQWIYFTYALGIFLYQTFDSCDGMHARRTGQQGPLGELFDHCIDALNTTLSLIPFWSSSGKGYSFMFIFTLFCLLGNFYLSTWEEYHTHVLYLSEFSGPIEGLLSIASVYVLCGIFGREVVWDTILLDVDIFGYEFIFQTIHLFYVFGFVGLVFNSITAFHNVVKYYKKRLHIDEREAEVIGERSMEGILPYLFYFASVFLLLLLDRTFISLPMILSIGFIFAFTVGRIIVNHLTKQPFPYFNLPMIIPTAQFVIYIGLVYGLGYTGEQVVDPLNWLGCGLSFALHGSFCNEIIYEFTTYLDMYALSIKYPKNMGLDDSRTSGKNHHE